MKTVEKIKEKLEVYKKIRDNASAFIRELASGAIIALEWVLEDDEENDTDSV